MFFDKDSAMIMSKDSSDHEEYNTLLGEHGLQQVKAQRLFWIQTAR